MNDFPALGCGAFVERNVIAVAEHFSAALRYELGILSEGRLSEHQANRIEMAPLSLFVIFLLLVDDKL